MRIYSKGEQGQGLTEYGLALVFVALVVIFALSLFGRRLSIVYEEINCAITSFPSQSGPLTILASGRTDNDTVWMKFNLSYSSEVTFTDLPSGFTETFYLGPQQYIWISDDESGQGYSTTRPGLITARTQAGAYVCGSYPAYTMS